MPEPDANGGAGGGRSRPNRRHNVITEASSEQASEKRLVAQFKLNDQPAQKQGGEDLLALNGDTVHCQESDSYGEKY